MKFHLSAAGVALLCLLAAPAAAEELPKWLTDAKARESRLAEPVDVASVDGWLRTKVPGAVQHRIVLQDGSYTIHIALEGGLTVTCEVLREAADLAALMARAADITFAELQKHHGTVEARFVEASDAGAVGPHPFLSMQWLYRANRQGERRVGALKQFAADLDDRTVYCAHDELGFARTFDTVARALTTHLRTGGDPAPQPHFREVSVVSLDGARVGVATTTMTRDADGDTKVVHKSALLAQRAPGQLLTQDVNEVQWVRPDGSLINARQAKAADGKLSESMALRRGDDERWRASGTLDGKPVDVVLAAAPSSYVALARARRQLMAQPQPVGASSEAAIWSSLDLTRLLPTRATVLAPAGADAWAVREEIGGVAMEAVLDRHTGTMVSARMPLGPRTMVFDRVFRDGAF